MEFSLKILSDKVLSGEKSLEIEKISKLLLGKNLSLKDISILNRNEFIDEITSPTIFFLHDEDIDDFIINHKIFYENESKIVGGEGVVTCKEFPIIVIPIEGDIINLLTLALEVVEVNFNLTKVSIFRLFGKDKEEVLSILEENEVKNCLVYGDGVLTDIYLNDTQKDAFINEDEALISNLFGEQIYTQNNLTMPEVAVKLLNISQKALCVYDGFTGGEIVKDLTSQFENLKVFGETFNILYQNEFIKKETEERCYRDEREFVYQTAYSALQEKKAGFSLSLIGKKKDNGYKIYMAIANLKNIDVYNLKIDGNWIDSVKIVKNWALFNLIKKLREKDFEN